MDISKNLPNINKFIDNVSLSSAKETIGELVSKGEKGALKIRDKVSSVIAKSANEFSKITGVIDRKLTQLEPKIDSIKTKVHTVVDSGITGLIPLNVLKAVQPLEKNQLSALSDPAEPKMHGENQREVITDTFKDQKGNIIGKEEAKRAKTVRMYQNSLKSEQKYYEEKFKALTNSIEEKKSLGDPKAELPQLRAERKQMKQRMDSLEDEINVHSNLRSSWASTSAPRLLFEKFGIMAAKQNALACLGNLRNQQLKIGGAIVSSINRSAAITDFTHGEVNFQDLKDLPLLKKTSQNPSSLTPTEKAHLRDYYGVDSAQLTAVQEKLNEMEGKIKQGYPELVEKNDRLDETKLKEITTNRRDHLRRQVLQDLQLHLEESPSMTQGNSIFLGRTALLDTTKKAVVDTNGFILDEKNQTMDMKALYDELDGATIVFDLEDAAHNASFFDEEGRIHMPNKHKPKGLEAGEVSCKLETAFMNISVQGNTKNQGVQNLVNEENLTRLEKKITAYPDGENKNKLMQLLNDLKTKVRPEKEGGFSAADTSIELMSLLGYVSIDCYGGKDRTGYAVAQVTQRKLQDFLKSDPSINSKEATALMGKFRRQLLSNDGIAVKVVEDNTGFKALKLTAVMLDLYIGGRGMDKFSGLVNRIADYAKLGSVLFAKTQSSEGALYQDEADISQMQQQGRLSTGRRPSSAIEREQ
jgi:hypothetical protein